MKIRRSLLVVAVLVITIPAWTFIRASTAGASPTCGQQSGSFQGFLGFLRQPTGANETPEGVSSYIVTRNAQICGNLNYPYTFSTAWVMLQDIGHSDHYAQAGYIWDSGSNCMRYFTEWNIGTNGKHRLTGACSTDGITRAYNVLYRGPAGVYPPCCGYMLLDGWGVADNANFDPWNRGWSFQPDYLGEVTHIANDMPGYSYDTADFTGMGIQSVDTGNLRTVPCYLKQGSPARSQFKTNANACDHIWIYTSPAGVG